MSEALQLRLAGARGSARLVVLPAPRWLKQRAIVKVYFFNATPSVQRGWPATG